MLAEKWTHRSGNKDGLSMGDQNGSGRMRSDYQVVERVCPSVTPLVFPYLVFIEKTAGLICVSPTVTFQQRPPTRCFEYLSRSIGRWHTATVF